MPGQPIIIKNPDDYFSYTDMFFKKLGEGRKLNLVGDIIEYSDGESHGWCVYDGKDFWALPYDDIDYIKQHSIFSQFKTHKEIVKFLEYGYYFLIN